MSRNANRTCKPGEHLCARRMFLQGIAAGGLAFGGFGRLFAASMSRWPECCPKTRRFTCTASHRTSQ
jgi:hypothetical protein